MNLFETLFLRNTKLNKEMFAGNLYYSYDDLSFLGFNKELLYKAKAFSKCTLIKHKEKNLGQGYKELKALLELDLKKAFIRIIINEDNLLSDILIYSIEDELTLEKYERIFFNDLEIKLDDNLHKSKETILLFSKNKLKIVKNSSVFLKHIGYEDWDFANKKEDFLNNAIKNYSSLISKFYEKKSFKAKLEFEMNGGAIISLDISFEYYYFNNDFYLISVLEK